MRLNDPVSMHVPGFERYNKGDITIRHLLTHTSGLSGLSETSDLRAVASQDTKLVDVLGDWVKDLPPDAAPARLLWRWPVRRRRERGKLRARLLGAGLRGHGSAGGTELQRRHR